MSEVTDEVLGNPLGGNLVCSIVVGCILPSTSLAGTMAKAREMALKMEKSMVLMPNSDASCGSQLWAKSKRMKWGLSSDNRVLIWGCIRSRATLRSSVMAGVASAVLSIPGGRPGTVGNVMGMILTAGVRLSIDFMRWTLPAVVKKEIRTLLP